MSNFSTPVSTSREHPYSPAFEVDGIAYVSGALSVDTHGEAVQGRSDALAAALRKLEERLATVGMTLGHVAKLTYYVTDISLRREANDQLMARFRDPRPARSFVEVSSLPYGCAVEIEAVAHRTLEPLR